MRTNFLIIAFAILIAFGLTYLSESRKPATGKAEVTELQTAFTAKPVPSFSFTDLSGEAHAIEDFRGKTVILNFWATWCPPCVEEFPQLLELAAKREDVVLVALSGDVNEAAVTNFLKKQDQTHLDHPDTVIAFDEKRMIAQDLFQTYRLPESIVIDPEGRMLRKIVGIVDWSTIPLD